MKILVIGAGVMGKQITDIFTKYGHEVKNVSQRRIQKWALIRNNGSFYDVIIETVREDFKLKQNILSAILTECNKDTIVCTNTSTYNVDDLTKGIMTNEHPLYGLHFFNPVSKISMVELASPSTNSNIDDISKLMQLIESIEKNSYLYNASAIRMSPVNTILFNQFIAAFSIVMESENSITYTDVDKLMKTCCKLPMGPFKLMDFIGLDIVSSVLSNMFEYKDNIQYSYKLIKYISDTLYTKVSIEYSLGVKTGKGFYDYTVDKNEY